MAVKIRLRRMGQIHAPYYRVIVADSRSPRNGRFIEEIGYYNPLTEPKQVKMKRGGEWTTITISNFQHKKLSDNLFSFNSKDFPTAEVIDLR